MPKPFKIKLSVPEPCKEDWDKMTPAEKGRYCSHCNKSVIDFSTYTDRELLDFFAKAKGHICGSFQNFQLDRLIVKQAPAATPMYRKLLYVTALAAGVAGTAYSQSSPNTVTKNQIDSKKSNNGNKAVLDSTYQISGTVVDSASGRPVPFVAMVIQHNGKQIRQTSTDGNGKFVFMLNKNYIGSHLTIFIENFGYDNITLKLKAENFPIYLPPIHLKGGWGVTLTGYRQNLIDRSTGIICMLPDSTDIHSRARPDGMVKGYYESGKLKSKVRYKYNLKTGKEKEYYETGKLKTVTHYKKGEPGITKRYDENGKEIK